MNVAKKSSYNTPKLAMSPTIKSSQKIVKPNEPKRVNERVIKEINISITPR
jgi:hypothetical protein